MAGSTFGNQFKIMTWGESHGAGVGVVIDGCPAGIPLAESDIQVMLNKRKPGQSKYTTPRKEDDEVEILSGIFEGKTTGTPISMVVRNKTQRSADYSEIARFFAGVAVGVCCIIFNKTISGKSYIYPLYPFDVKKLKRSIFRVRLPHSKNN